MLNKSERDDDSKISHPAPASNGNLHMNVLLTGAAGLIGMALRPQLAARGHRVVPIDITDFGRGDAALRMVRLDDRPALDALVAAEAIDAVIHCGAISGPMIARGEPLKLVAANVDGTAQLLDIARLAGIMRFVFCSSISVYGNVGPGRITEATALKPTSLYGATKVACEQLIQGMRVEYGLSGVSLRIGRVYGPYRRAHCHLKTMQVETAAGRETVIPCDPGFVYHYVYVEDVAAAIIAALEAPHPPNGEYNVGSGHAMTMPEIVTLACASLPETRVRLVAGADDVPDIQTEFDCSLIARDLGWSPRFDIGAGVLAYRDALRAGDAAL
jgi:UDP-glucose 4-epimerase